MPDDREIIRDANGYDYESYPSSRLARQQKVLNESWPDGVRYIDDQPYEKQLSVLVRLVFEGDGEDFLPGLATRWTRTHVHVIVDDPRVQNHRVWLLAEEVKRA